MARLPHDYETPHALLRELFPVLLGRHDARTLVNVFNAATAPFILRGEEEAERCNRIARLCGRIRANRYGGRTIDYRESNGAWIALAP